ncbi:MAG TPA: hypothetical protein VFQ23_15050, partial [Anaerolineales bacterium]|nr:hypothetical protein [Anaerolineales bacterium]
WRHIFAQLFGLDFTTSMSGRKEALVSTLDDDLVERAALLNDILQVDFPHTELTANLDGRVLAENTRAMLTTILHRATRQTPRLITIEDAHWMDSASLALLMDVSRLVNETFLMLIITTRPLTGSTASEAAQLLRLPYARHIKLEPLPAQETLTLVAYKLGVRELPAEVNALILKKAEGHPFFSEELAYALRDTGILLIENGRSLLAPGINNLETLDLPETVQGVILSRIDRLTPIQQLTLKVASVIGRVFEYATLKAVYPIEAERTMLRPSLVSLEQLDITPLETPDPELAYIFKHSITRDVAYDLMLFAQRRQLHRSAAEWYEQTHAKDLEPYYGLLAHHYALAEESAKAIQYLEKAGDHALSRGAYVEGVNFFDEAIRISEQNRREVHFAPVQRARWEFQLGEAYMGLGTLQEGRKHFEHAATLLGWASPKRKSALLMSVLMQLGWQVTRLIRGKPFRPARDPSRALDAARVHERLGELYYFAQDRLRLLNSTLHTLNLSQKAPPSPELARAYALACSVATIIRLRGLAKRYEEHALQTAAQLNNLPAQARVLSRTGYYNIGIGNFKRAIQLLDQAAEISERLRDYRQWGESASLRAWTAYLIGDFEDNRARYERVFLMAKQVGNIQYLNWGQWGQAHGLLRMNRLEESRRALASVIKQIESGEYSGAQVLAFGLMSIVCMHLQDWANMLEYGKRLVRTERRPDRISIADFEGYASVAEVFLTLWQQAANTDILKQINLPLEECQTYARRAIKSMQRFARLYALAKPRSHDLTGWLEWLDGQQQDAIQTWKKGLRLHQTAEMPYEEARLHHILGKHLPSDDPESQAHREQARQLFIRLNAQLDLNKE